MILYYIVLYSIILYYTILYETTLYYAMLYYTILCCIILYYTILYNTILYCTVLHYTVSCYSILYYIILYYIICSIILYYTQVGPGDRPAPRGGQAASRCRGIGPNPVQTGRTPSEWGEPRLGITWRLGGANAVGKSYLEALRRHGKIPKPEMKVHRGLPATLWENYEFQTGFAPSQAKIPPGSRQKKLLEL